MTITEETPLLTVRLENPPVSARQRKLFHRLLWHAVDLGGDSDELDMALAPLAELLDIEGKIEARLLLACQELVATRVRWTLAHDGKEMETGFCPLLAQCWCTHGRLHYTFPSRLNGFIRTGRLFRGLKIPMDDLFRSPHGAALYEHLKTLADLETDGWRETATLFRLLGLEPEQANGLSVKTDIIDPALAEINTLSEIQAQAQYREAGEAIEAVKFRVRYKAAPASSCLRLPGPAAPDSQQALMDAFEAHKAEQVCTLTREMDPREIEAVQRSFLVQIQDNPVLMAKYERDGFDSLAVKLRYEVFLEELLLTDDQRDFLRFKVMGRQGGLR